jgi:hypothetical protein
VMADPAAPLFLEHPFRNTGDGVSQPPSVALSMPHFSRCRAITERNRSPRNRSVVPVADTFGTESDGDCPAPVALFRYSR